MRTSPKMVMGVLVLLAACGTGNAGPRDEDVDGGTDGSAEADSLVIPGEGPSMDGPAEMASDGPAEMASRETGIRIDERLCTEMCAVGLQVECPEQPTMSACVLDCLQGITTCIPETKDFFGCIVANGTVAFECDEVDHALVLKDGYCISELSSLDSCMDPATGDASSEGTVMASRTASKTYSWIRARAGGGQP
jgi:hypothetical protein